MTTRLTRFILDRSGIRKVGQSRQLATQMHDDAQVIADNGRMLAPFLTGEYRDSIHVEDFLEDGLVKSRAIAGSDHALPVELGTSDTPTFAPLRRGAELAGFRLRA